MPAAGFVVCLPDKTVLKGPLSGWTVSLHVHKPPAQCRDGVAMAVKLRISESKKCVITGADVERCCVFGRLLSIQKALLMRLNVVQRLGKKKAWMASQKRSMML